MSYKTIILELLQRSPQLHEQLRRGRMLLTATESLATALKARHESLKDQLSATKPDHDPAQTASMAMEIAVQEMEHRLQAAFPAEGQGRLSLDAAMAFVRSLTSRV
ncbi:MAG: hypothetical protein IPM18_09200 [Phycisphaerales bacterium]|nr:hypothetical protein [Phycisphaerales bacterium]